MKYIRKSITPVFAVSGMALVVALGFYVISDFSHAQSPATQPARASKAGVPTQPSAEPFKSLTWLLNNPSPHIIPAAKANPVAVADKFASRAKAIEQRATLRAFEGAPPVIPHAIAGVNIGTCRACHGEGIRAGDKVARMTSHTQLTNCTQCHVEAASPHLGDDAGPINTFVGIRPGGYGGTRAYTGAPPVMPHSVFMRTHCVSCHGEFGYDGWRPDHLSRTNCIQCHSPAAEFDQLSPAFAVPDVPDGMHVYSPGVSGK